VIPNADLDCDDAGEASAAATAGDCDDAAPSVFPGATEVTADGVDQDCDGLEICFVDVDGDGLRPDETSTVASTDTDCADEGEGTADMPALDCDDTQADADDDGADDYREEVELRTDSCNPDTDDDGLEDGDEVDTYSTDPLDPDTDDGGANDGLEIGDGTDPLDPSDDLDDGGTDKDGDEPDGCGCATTTRSNPWLIVLMASVIARWRRRAALAS
jgi:hypothetical protein